MTKDQFLERLQELYRVANAADSDQRADWTSPNMALATCRSFDAIIAGLKVDRVLTETECRGFYDGL